MARYPVLQEWQIVFEHNKECAIEVSFSGKLVFLLEIIMSGRIYIQFGDLVEKCFITDF
jgi:hypothetical protein